MNYLAHIFLSGNNRKRQIGNYIGDAVKGSTYNNYPPDIREGILLHRAIDSYTDEHPLVHETVKLLRPYFGRYSGALLDIYFDHLLASNFDEYSPIPLKTYTRCFYWNMIRHRSYLPDRFRRFMWHFIFTNRLCKYATKAGIAEALRIMEDLGRMKVSADEAMRYLNAHEDDLLAVFRTFFVDLMTFVRTRQAECDASSH